MQTLAKWSLRVKPGKKCKENYLLHLKDGTVARPKPSNVLLLWKTQSLPTVQLWFLPPYLLIQQVLGALVCLVFGIMLVMVLLTTPLKRQPTGPPTQLHWVSRNSLHCNLFPHSSLCRVLITFLKQTFRCRRLYSPQAEPQAAKPCVTVLYSSCAGN